MEETIELGDLVQTTDGEKQGVVTGIKDYGTHVCYFIDTGDLLRFPAKREWIKIVQKGFIKL